MPRELRTCPSPSTLIYVTATGTASNPSSESYPPLQINLRSSGICGEAAARHDNRGREEDRIDRFTVAPFHDALLLNDEIAEHPEAAERQQPFAAAKLAAHEADRDDEDQRRP